MQIDGTTAIVRPAGGGRYIVAAFLCLWLGGWAMGEAFAVWVLVMLPGSTTGAPAIVGLIFIVVWLLVWTFAGIAAINQVLRSLAGEDRIEVQGTALAVTRRAGPFSRVTSYERSDVRAVRLRPKDQAVVIDTATTNNEVTKFGTLEERTRLAEWLQHRLAVPAMVAVSAEQTPHGWMVRTESGMAVLTRFDRRSRWLGGGVAWIVTATGVMSCVAAIGAGTLAGAALALGTTLVSATVAFWLTFGVSEWMVRPGSIACRTRFLLWRSERIFQSGQLTVTITTERRGNRDYKLEVTDSHGSKTISYEMNDDARLRELGRWLSVRSGFPLT